MALVHVPAPLRTLIGGESELSVPGETLEDLIRNLDSKHPGIAARLTEGDRLRPGLAVFVDGAQATAGLRTRLNPESEVYFSPAISGGR